VKYGFNLLMWTTQVTRDHLPLLRKLKAAGYDGVEIPVFEGDTAHYQTLRRILSDEGLASTVVGIVPDEARNPLSSDPARSRAGVDYLKWLVDCSVALGAEVLCGPFYQPLGIFSGTGLTDAERDRLITTQTAMADHAAGAILLAVEPLNRFECYALNTNADAARLVEDVNRPNYRYLYDTFHSNIEDRDPVGAVTATAAAIGHVHLSENDRGTLGRGHAPLAATCAALKAAGYKGWLTCETFGLALPSLAAATKCWRPLYGSEHEAYTEALHAMRKAWAA
jgi:D-psicose/D-tagatose/L-ribulose 3-epimerase